MTDLLQVLPDFPTQPYTHLLPSLDKHHVTTADLLTLDAVDVAKRAQLPVAGVRQLTDAILEALHHQLRLDRDDKAADDDRVAKPSLYQRGDELSKGWKLISTLDDGLDAALGGGIPTGYLTEITGESGAGKTQFLLTLLLSAQLPAPNGLSKPTLYISTEAPLATSRLTQLLRSHPRLSSQDDTTAPSLSRILSIQTPDLESQEHILRYQLPVAIARHGIGLIVIDSIAANYRAEFERPLSRNGGGNGGTTIIGGSDTRDAHKRHGRSMAERRAQLIALGALLRDLARNHDVAIVVANQVADRFAPSPTAMTTTAPSRQASQTASEHGTPVPSGAASPHSTPPLTLNTPDPLTLDHQQRWFSGWGALSPDEKNLKTPSLGLVWTNQIAARIALAKAPVYKVRDPLAALVAGLENRENRENQEEEEDGGNEAEIVRWKRWVRVVFAAWCAPTEGRGVAFEILGRGVRSVG